MMKHDKWKGNYLMQGRWLFTLAASAWQYWILTWRFGLSLDLYPRLNLHIDCVTIHYPSWSTLTPRGRQSIYKYAYRVTIETTILGIHGHSHMISVICIFQNRNSQSIHEYAYLVTQNRNIYISKIFQVTIPIWAFLCIFSNDNCISSEWYH